MLEAVDRNYRVFYLLDENHVNDKSPICLWPSVASLHLSQLIPSMISSSVHSKNIAHIKFFPLHFFTFQGRM